MFELFLGLLVRTWFGGRTDSLPVAKDFVFDAVWVSVAAGEK